MSTAEKVYEIRVDRQFTVEYAAPARLTLMDVLRQFRTLDEYIAAPGGRSISMVYPKNAVALQITEMGPRRNRGDL